MMYFKEYAENFGEQQPDCPEIHLPSCLTKIAVFKDYKLQCDVSQQPSISLSSFYEMWRKEFSHVKLRKVFKFIFFYSLLVCYVSSFKMFIPTEHSTTYLIDLWVDYCLVQKI